MAGRLGAVGITTIILATVGVVAAGISGVVLEDPVTEFVNLEDNSANSSQCQIWKNRTQTAGVEENDEYERKYNNQCDGNPLDEQVEEGNFYTQEYNESNHTTNFSEATSQCKIGECRSQSVCIAEGANVGESCGLGGTCCTLEGKKTIEYGESEGNAGDETESGDDDFITEPGRDDGSQVDGDPDSGSSYKGDEGELGSTPVAVSRDEILNQPYEPLKIDNNAERPVDLPSCEAEDARIIEPSDAGNLESILEDENNRVFCMTPGDYRDQGVGITDVSGTEENPRWIRYYNPDMPEGTHPWNMADPETEGASERVIMEGIYFRDADHWVLDRLRFDSKLQAYNGNNFLFNRLMFYDSDSTVQLKLYDTTNSHIQNSVIGKTQEGSKCDSGADSNGITVRMGSSYTTIVDNEIFDYWCGDGVQYSAPDVKTYGGVIQDNDFYLTEEFQEADKPVENAIDLKSGPADTDTASLEGVSKEDWTIVENNRLWGESNNMIYHWQAASGTIIRNNLIFDLSGEIGFAYAVPQKDETNTNHLFYDNILHDTGGGLKPRHIHDSVYARNIIADADGRKPGWSWFADPENNLVTRNVFMNTDLGNPTDNNDVRDNAFYDSEPFDGGDPAIEESSAEAANHGDLTIEVRPITGPETKTLPNVEVTQMSPHAEWFDANNPGGSIQ